MDEKDRRYKIMNESTTGWVIIDDKEQNLTKQECDRWINKLLNAGANPNYFKVVAQDDPRYPHEV